MSASTIESVLEDYRESIAAFLRGKDSVFGGVEIITDKKGDAITEINKAFLSAGVFGKVSIRQARVKIAQCKDVLIERVDFTVDFYENVPLNQSDTGTKKGAWGLAENALLALNYERLPDSKHVIQPTEGQTTLEDVTKDPDSGDLVVRLRLSTKLELPAPTP